MLFEVVLRIIVAPGKDGVTPEENADGFKSEWASLPIPMPQARAIALAKLQVGAGMREHAPYALLATDAALHRPPDSDSIYTGDYESPTLHGDFQIETRFQLWAVSVDFQDDWTHYRLSARFLGHNERKLLNFKRRLAAGHDPFVTTDIFVNVKLCCDVKACLQQTLQQQGVLHRQALLPLQQSLDDMNAQFKGLQNQLSEQSIFDVRLANSNRLQRWLIAVIQLISAVLVRSILSC